MLKQDTSKLDIVYMVKASDQNEELRYSLRSVAKNLPHRKVWIYGGLPKGIKPDEYVKIQQVGITKWDRVQAMLRKVCSNENITDDFILFNDDFFVMKPTEFIPILYRCPLYEHIVKLEMKYGNQPTEYSKLLRAAVKKLELAGVTCNSYELHIPMVMNKAKLIEVLETFPKSHCLRTLYGNYHKIGGKRADDVKVYEAGQAFDKNTQFLSTTDGSFSAGEIGEFIRRQFVNKCKFEE